MAAIPTQTSPDPCRQLFERSADAILIIEGETFIDCNDAAVAMLRYPNRAQVLQTHPSELSPPTQPDGRDSRQKADEMIALAFERGSHRFEWMHRRAGGEAFPVEVLLTAVQEQNRRVLYVVWRELTERKRLEAELRHAQKMEALGKLAGGIAHDFNNLLLVILGQVDRAARRVSGDPETGDALQEARSAAQRAAALVRQLLVFGRKEQPKSDIVDVTAVIEESRGLVETLVGESVEVHLHLSPAPLPVYIDATQLQQVVLNLASNARDAMPGGGQLIVRARSVVLQGDEVGRPVDAPRGACVELTVADNGVGMDGDTVRHAFDPFFTTKEVGRGTGLGLASAYGAVKQAAGSITLRSRVDHGTTVKILLPLADMPAPVRVVTAEPERVGGDEMVLVVEDERSVASLVEALLQQRGYRVRVARDGEEALAVLGARGSEIDLVLSDVIMPRMGGAELFRRARAEGHRTRFLLMSGYTGDALARSAPLPEAVELLEKPFPPELFLQRVRATLDRPVP